ncbi:tRNA glutamyl-Q(34) synthetase GluQRS [Marinomonas piezotolerans]|uniref:tRNA glutamyl-Q(34) synthetase GluQRS n=1 Tax=Marinomonas piezotolerans TaxID=2213058 RepID=A0A370U8J9_9GAMM|nr:tRNA glutamyl-Q(34) synthetase GluQRS [Marinomonas piezotolerans]RDL44097.1 tRNA glutamyl-Q(34) synthetase GluQRS [Marinomonas piezotolerans]
MCHMYRGRFAPSPTGPLHFGSLLSAVASYLDARSQAGTWLIRLEDVDGTRCSSHFSQTIIETLNSYQLISDEEILYQSDRHELYQNHLEHLFDLGLVYPCNCTRADLKRTGGLHPDCCNGHTNTPHSWRAKCEQGCYTYEDPIQGTQHFDLSELRNHPVLKRKDNYFSYQLAVVVDDHLQNITDIVRGADLLETTGQQLWLYDQFTWQAPKLCHIPLIVNAQGDKISKQNHAKAIDDGCTDTLRRVLHYLGFSNIPAMRSIDTLLKWATENWNRNLPAHHNLALNSQDLHFIQ